MTKGGEWNGWKGWGCEPKPGDVQPWHDLTNFLFQNCPSNKIWVEKWLAFPLQNPGVKLLSSVVIYGQAKGTGKTFIAYLMGDIYGDNFIEVDNDDSGRSTPGRRTTVHRRRSAGSPGSTPSPKRIARGTVTISDKYVPRYHPDRCNYLLTSNHPMPCSGGRIGATSSMVISAPRRGSATRSTTGGTGWASTCSLPAQLDRHFAQRPPRTSSKVFMRPASRISGPGFMLEDGDRAPRPGARHRAVLRLH